MQAEAPAVPVFQPTAKDVACAKWAEYGLLVVTVFDVDGKRYDVLFQTTNHPC